MDDFTADAVISQMLLLDAQDSTKVLAPTHCGCASAAMQGRNYSAAHSHGVGGGDVCRTSGCSSTRRAGP